ncbi:tetratricopeptide repeat protein [Pseudomonas nunensis]|uniref:tetratricopeptide repeat protein n=1 Tax=Pseudomonas nunensis TaxID=2961896 RepID=UPI00210C4664|nr:sel1 repeat family protein [Pseudomonas nunensis]
MTKNNQVRSFSFKWLALLTFGLSSGVFAAECPSDDFAGFIKAFSAEPEIQKAFIASPLTEQTVVATGLTPQVVQKQTKALDPHLLAVLAPNNVVNAELNVNVELPNQLFVRDHKGRVLNIFTFEKSECWKLVRVEDWSLENVLNAQKPESRMAPGERELKRGTLYNDLGMEAEFPASTQLFISALDSYLNGAEQGSKEAAYKAALLSLSGQAPRLDNGKILALLKDASTTVAGASLALADFYCDEGHYDQQRSCANPEKSMEALQSAVKLGSVDAVNQLGTSLERGSLVPQDTERALACYQIAAAKGLDISRSNAERLSAQGVQTNESKKCL